MSTIGQGEYRSKLASADLSSYQYRFVKLDSTNGVNYCDSSATRPYGILQNAPTSGQVAWIKVSGESLLDSTATSGFAYGVPLTSGSTGKGVAVTGGSYIAAYSAGNAVSSMYNNLIPVKLIDDGAVSAAA